MANLNTIERAIRGEGSGGSGLGENMGILGNESSDTAYFALFAPNKTSIVYYGNILSHGDAVNVNADLYVGLSGGYSLGVYDNDSGNKLEDVAAEGTATLYGDTATLYPMHYDASGATYAGIYANMS